VTEGKHPPSRIRPLELADSYTPLLTELDESDHQKIDQNKEREERLAFLHQLSRSFFLNSNKNILLLGGKGAKAG